MRRVAARPGGWRAALALAALLALCGGARTVGAHATLLSADPAPGAALTRAPDIVVLHFDEPVAPIAARVLDARGQAVSRDDAVRVAGHDLVVPIADRGVRGHLTVSYRVTSVDAHVVAGSFGLDVGAPAQSGGAPAGETTTAASPWLVAGRALLYASVLLAIGTLLFRTLVAPAAASPRDGVRLRAIVAAGVTGALVHVVATAAAAAPGAAFAVASIHAALRTSLGPALSVVVAGLVAALLVPRLGRGAQAPVALAAVVAMAGGLAATGHAAGADAGLAMRGVVAAHVVAAGFWVGALRVKIPDEVQSLKVEQKAGWRVQIRKRPLATPRTTEHRAPQTDTVDEVEWRGGPLGDGLYEDFGLLASLPATPGRTIYFPVVQECEKGVSRWIELPQAGIERLEHPAPGVKVLPRP